MLKQSGTRRMKGMTTFVAVAMCIFSLEAMDHKTEKESISEVIIKLEQILENQKEQKNSNSKMMDDERIIPKDIVITMTLQEFFELQKKSEQPNILATNSLQPTEYFVRDIDAVKNGVQALRDGKPYNAWHYISSSGGIVASLSSLAGVIITLVILLK